MAGFRRIVLIGAVLAIGIGGAKLQAQTQLADPKDAPKIFASTCSTCHKSPRGLAKSGQVAGFLRQHYTTGPEMSAAMAAYLVAVGSEPPAKKGAAETAQKQKSKKDGSPQAEHAALTAPEHRTLRGRQRAKQDEAQPAAQPAQPAAAAPTAAEPERQTAAAPAAASAPSETPTASVPAQEAGPPPVVFDIPLPEMPQAPPPDLTQSAFTSSPLP